MEGESWLRDERDTFHRAQMLLALGHAVLERADHAMAEQKRVFPLRYSKRRQLLAEVQECLNEHNDILDEFYTLIGKERPKYG